MLDYSITKNAANTHWVVTCRKDNSAGLKAHVKDEVIFEVPVSADTKTDMYTCVSLLASNFPTATIVPDAMGDRVLSYLYSPKYIPITVFSSSSTKAPTVKSTFKGLTPHEAIKQLAIESAQQVCPDHTRYVEGARISTAPDIANLEKLRDKMCKTGTVYNADPVIFKAVSAALLHMFQCDQWVMYASTDPNAPYHLNFNPNSGVGFRHYELMFARNKRNMAPFAIRIVERYLQLVREHLGESEELLPPPITTYTAKPEVQSVDTPIGKVRLISMLGLVHDFISKLCTLPFMRCLEKWVGCLIGTSVWSSLTYTMLRAMHLREWLYYDFHMRGGVDIDPDEVSEWGYLTMDISGHDMSYSPVGLFMYLLMRLFCVDYRCPADQEAFAEMFAVEMAGVNAKTVKWFGGYHYMVLGVMASGWLGTSHIATLMTIHSTYMALFKIYIKNKLHPKLVFSEFRMVAYGDDVVLKYKANRADLLGDGNVPHKLADALLEIGLTVKGEETQMFPPKQSHKNRFFTHIRGDKIHSAGVHILQRYFVKFDERHNPMHPDSEKYAYILPWRKTDAYATKMGVDAWGFAGKEGRLDKTPFDPYVMAYLKAFGLLMDAGPNRTAHKLLKEFMRKIESAKPGTARASQKADRGELNEILAKLGPNAASIDGPMISRILFMDDKKSYMWVVSKIVTDMNVRELKTPEYRYADVASVNGPVTVGKPYILNQEVIYI